MTTITREFTKEQLIKHLEEQQSGARYALSFVRDSEILRDIEMDLRISEIARSSLDSAPVAWTDEQELQDVENSGCGYLFTVNPVTQYAYPLRIIKLYTAPPAPLVPGEITPLQASRAYGGEVRGYRDGWNACRAAMLQGADGTLTNEDTKRVGELVMWVKRLAHSLRKANPDSKLQSDAMDYLNRKGLIGVEDILR